MIARRLEGVQIEHAADEILAMRTANSEAHAVDQNAAAVYDLCDGNTSKSKMVRDPLAHVTRGYDCPYPHIRCDVPAFTSCE